MHSTWHRRYISYNIAVINETGSDFLALFTFCHRYFGVTNKRTNASGWTTLATPRPTTTTSLTQTLWISSPTKSYSSHRSCTRPSLLWVSYPTWLSLCLKCCDVGLLWVCILSTWRWVWHVFTARKFVGTFWLLITLIYFDYWKFFWLVFAFNWLVSNNQDNRLS